MGKIKQNLRIILSVVIVVVALIVIWFIRDDQNIIAAVTLAVMIIEIVINWKSSDKNKPPEPQKPPIGTQEPSLPPEDNGTSIQICPPPDSAFISRFAMSRGQLDMVLELRRAFFAERLVSSDKSYIKCWKRNHYVFKIINVYENTQNKPLGYWGLIPIYKSAYFNFLKGEISHEEMLSNETIDWCDIDPYNVYIYVIGAVLPESANAASPLEQWYVKIMSSRILIDMFDFAEVLSSLIKIKGICGYPSRTGGADIFSKLSFRQNGIYIDGDENQPVSYIPENEIERLLRETKYYSEKHGHIVRWDKDDRDRFLIRVNKCVDEVKQSTDSRYSA